MKKTLLVIFPIVCTIVACAQTISNTSYQTASGEKVLRLEFVLPISQSDAWRYFSSDDMLAKWAAPLAHIEMRTGGYLVTNYDKSKSLSDSSSIRTTITNYIEGQLLTLKVKLNNSFPKSTQNEDQNLQEIIQLIAIDPQHTKIISSMVGWGQGQEWEQTYSFFDKGNTWTYDQLLKLFK
jgi:hypothetical protein